MEKKISKIEELVKKIDKKLSANVIEKARKYDEMVSLLNDIEIEVISSVEIDNQSGDKFVKVEYKIPTAKIYTNDEGEIECPKHFKAINLLNLIPISTISKLTKEIEIIEKFNK